MGMIFYALISGVLATEFKATALSGTTTSGELLEVSADGLAIRTADGIVRVDGRQVATVDALTEPLDTTAANGVQIQLIDGSRLWGNQVVVSRGTANLTRVEMEPVEVSSRAIQWIRLRRSTELNPMWNEQLAIENKGDVVIVRKTGRPAEGEERPATVLDRVEGIIKEITADTVHFELDGELVKIKREKLEGLIYFQPPGRELVAAVCRLTDSSRSIWNAKAIQLEGTTLLVSSAAGAKSRIPLSALRQLDYSVVNTQYLDAIDPDSWEWQPFFESRVAAGNLQRFSGRGLPDGDASSAMRLGGRSYDRGLQMRSRTVATFRIPKDAQRFLATVGIDDRLGESGNVQLLIRGDNRQLYSQSIVGGAEPQEVSLDVSGVRRLTLLVDYGDELDIGDYLDLCNARFTR